MGAAFPIVLMLRAFAGTDLFTGNTAYFIPPLMQKRVTVLQMLRNWSVVYFANFLGALFFAYFMVYLTGIFDKSPWHESIIHLAEAKTSLPFFKVFLKGVGVN